MLLKRSRPRWTEDQVCYIKLLRVLGFRGKNLRKKTNRLVLKESYHSRFLSDVPVSPRLIDYKGPEIDHAWIEGETCSPLFDRLSHRERLICYLFNTETTKDILRILDISRFTYFQHLRDIRSKLTGGK